MRGRRPISELVAEGDAFDDLDPSIPRNLALYRAAALQVEAIVATVRGLTREHGRCR
jgi:hypothetical protein